MSPHAELRRELVDRIADLPKRDGFHYSWPAEFVLAHGERFDAAPLPKPYPYRRFRAERGCYSNAARLAEHHPELTYVEGFATNHLMAVLHAWCVDQDGRVVDPTPAWRDAHERRAAYLGVRLPTALVTATAMERQAWGSLLDNWEQGWPLLRGPWRGGITSAARRALPV